MIPWIASSKSSDQKEPHFLEKCKVINLFFSKYRIYWKLDKADEDWHIEDIADWRIKEIMIRNQPTYQPYRIKVVAHNAKGKLQQFYSSDYIKRE